MTEQEEFWAGEFGDEYTARNQIDWRSRYFFWSKVMKKIGARSVYELGCNSGWNLSCISKVNITTTVEYFDDLGCSASWKNEQDAPTFPVVYGHDVNENAIKQAHIAGLTNTRLMDLECIAELAFTAGVLIHVAPDHLKNTMQSVIEHSAKYILAIEYFSPREEMIEYRGHQNKLWRRPYGKLYQDMGLTLIESGDAGSGFDKCTYWLLRK